MTEKLHRDPLYEQAYAALLGMILNGTLQLGQFVTEKHLAELLGVSSTPVREAMRRLEQDGLLERKGNTAQIAQLTRDDIEQLYICREALEVLAIESAVNRLDDVALEELEAILSAAERAALEEDCVEVLQLNTEFHRYIVGAAGNRWLTSLAAIVMRPLFAARMRIVFDQAELRRVLSDHRSLFEALKNHDRKAAADTLVRHVRVDCEHTLQQLPQTEP